MATLSGSLQTLSLPEVARLIASAGKSGLLYVEGADVFGRLYFVDGELTYATTRSDLGFADQDRRIVDPNRMSDDQTNDLLRQQVTDVMVRLMSLSGGMFSFEDGEVEGGRSGAQFSVEAVLRAASDRIADWERIMEVLPDVDTPVRLNPQIDSQEVTLDARSWAVISALGSHGTATSVAQNLKLFEFAAAKKLAELIRRGLVSVVTSTWDDLPQDGSEMESEAVVEEEEQEPEEGPREEEEVVAAAPPSEDHEPPVSELAKRWRELSNARQRGDG